MITVTLKSRPYAFPTRWEEFTPAMGRTFLRMAHEMALFETGAVPFDEFTVTLTLAILGVDKVRKMTDEFSENIYRLGEHLRFPYTVRTLEDGSRVADLTVCLSENLLPEIGGVRGYTFRRESSGRMDCSLTAEQYIDALELMQAWQNTKQTSALENLVRTLYPGAKRIQPDEAFAVYYNFRGILAWIRSIPAYALIFPPEESGHPGSGRNPVGLASSIFTLAKAGYGDINAIKDLPLFSYLGLLMQQTIESIRTLAASGLKPTQISERLGLSIDLVLQHTK